MALCTIRCGKDWVEIASPTGKQLRITGVKDSSLNLDDSQKTLLSLLMRGKTPRAEELTHDQMRVFVSIHKKISDSDKAFQGEVAPPLPTEDETPEVQESKINPLPEPKQEEAGISQKTAEVIHDNVAWRTSSTYSANGHENRINRLQEVSNKLNQDNFVMLIYDIPDVKRRECPNPSRRLWRHGFRINLSCWVLPSKQMESEYVTELLAHWSEHKIKTYVIPQAESQRDEIRKIAREKLEEEVRSAHTSLIERIQAADKRYKALLAQWEAADAGMDGSTSKEDIDRSHVNAERLVLREAGERLNAAIQCAELFDETESVQDLLQGLREAIQAEIVARKVVLHVGKGNGRKK